jgi:hypothetical protein
LLYKQPSTKAKRVFITEHSLDLLLLLTEVNSDRRITVSPRGEKILLSTRLSRIGQEPKAFMINRFIELDDLFFEGLGLWVGEGGKDKGLYFGNSSPELLLRFLEFVEKKLGIDRQNFMVTVNVPASVDENSTKRKWSEILQIPTITFTKICVDSRISKEYAQIYYNGVALAELMKTLQRKLEPMILSTERFAIPFLRGIFAAEGQVALRKQGALHVTFSTADSQLLSFLKKSLQLVGITSGKYMTSSRKFPIYGYTNLKRFKELNIHTLHPEKRMKFELGFANYKRKNVLDGEKARTLVLGELTSGPKTYNELAAALGKARTTIQAWHIPILEREGKVRRIGKRGQAWLFEPTEKRNPATNT